MREDKREWLKKNMIIDFKEKKIDKLENYDFLFSEYDDSCLVLESLEEFLDKVVEENIYQ